MRRINPCFYGFLKFELSVVRYQTFTETVQEISFFLHYISLFIFPGHTTPRIYLQCTTCVAKEAAFLHTRAMNSIMHSVIGRQRKVAFHPRSILLYIAACIPAHFFT